MVENAGLTELPVPLLGSFDPDFLDVPEEVIQLTARINQKYFVMRDGAGKLAPHFVCVANIDANDGGEAIVAGNERVLAARLSDARFFWEQDLKVPLEEQAKKLERIVFHEKLGTVADKVERVAKLARWLVEEGIVKGADPDQAERAARLAKADLVTGMVGEFPELQGVIGGYLARAQGEPDAVADAIRDHYKPVGQGDEVPTAPVTVAVSLADKLDTLVAFFAIEQKPTGSKDPFALRRAALGVDRADHRERIAVRHAQPWSHRTDVRTCGSMARPIGSRIARLLRRPPQGAAARCRRSARPDRRGVCARRRGRSGAAAGSGEGAAGVRRDGRGRQPARRLQARGEYPEEGKVGRRHGAQGSADRREDRCAGRGAGIAEAVRSGRRRSTEAR